MIGKRTVSVSIVAANYNNGKYLQQFIESVSASTVLPHELIIVDDGSTDDSLTVLNGYSDLLFLRVIPFKQNLGFTAALNAGIEASTGKYIMRADPDDLLHPERIGQQYQFMEENPDLDVLGSNVLYFNDQDGSDITVSNFPLTDIAIKKAYLQGEHGLMHATTILKTNVFKQYRYQHIFPGEDYELFSRMVKDGHKFQNLARPLYKVRVHAGSSSSNLKFESIRQTFAFRDQIFGTKTSKCRIVIYFQHIRHYRSYQMAGNSITKYFHLLLSVLFYPAKLVKRLKKATRQAE